MKKRVFACLLALTLGFPLSLSAATLGEVLSGRILLQVESRGEAWYVNPVDHARYYLGTPDDAWNLMRSFALGISNTDLSKTLPARLAGRILLAVEDHGKAYYVDPVSMQPYYLGRPADAFALMTSRGLGISNANLAVIPAASIGSVQNEVMESVPFTSQAPFGEWSDPRQADGCEEASAVMAVYWAAGKSLSQSEAKSLIVNMSNWEKNEFGSYVDTSAKDTAERLVKTYLGYQSVEVRTGISTSDIVDILSKGQIAIVPVNGQKLGNPHYVAPGPLHHMIVVTGYDIQRGVFLTNDPGTQYGEGYEYSASVLGSALRDYLSGDHLSRTSTETAMIVVSR